MSMIDLFVPWFGTTASIVTIGSCLDLWLEESVRVKLSQTLSTRLRPDPARWFHAVEEAFSTLFDRLYGWRRPRLDRLIWQGILFSYIILFLARIVLWAFQIPVPDMEKILVTAFVTSIGLTILLHAADTTIQLTSSSESQGGAPILDLIRNRRFRSAVLTGSVGVALYTAAAILAGDGVGVSFKNVAAIAFGAGIGVPTIVLVSRVRDDMIPVAPLRAIASSLVFVGLLATFFPGAAYNFLTKLEQAGPLVLSVVAFNIFGDAVSLVETRWMLRLSRGLPAAGIIGMLILDLILSGLIYVVLPGISDVDWRAFVLAVQFAGPLPWMGILFWGTFFTSLLFYLFVAAMLILRILAPVARLVDMLDNLFAVYRHPVRLITLAMVSVETGMFALVALLK
jgi:hypothetical protein